MRSLTIALTVVALSGCFFRSREVGRVKAEAEEKEPTAKYVDFTSDERTPLLRAGSFELRAAPKAP